MISPMHQVIVAGRQRDSREIMAALQRAGVLHIVPLSAAGFETGPLGGLAADERRSSERLLARVESTLGELGALRGAPAPLPPEGEWTARVEEVAQPASVLNARETELQSDLDTQTSYGEVVRVLARLAGGVDTSRRLALLTFTVQTPEELSAVEAALREDLGDRSALASDRVNQNTIAAAVAVLRADREKARAALSRARVGELRLPGRFDALPVSEVQAEFERIARANPAALNEVRAEKRRLAAAHGARLYAIRDALADRVAIDDARAQTARGKYGFVLQGYVPDESMGTFRSAMDGMQGQVVYEVQPADEHHAETIPVKLRNSPYARNFEFLLGVSEPPRYGTFDPTWMIAAFFPLFFGFVVADIGFGLIFLLAALWMQARGRRGEDLDLGFLGIRLDPATLQQVSTVIRTMSLWTILWGFLTGEFFGNVLEKLHVFYLNPGLIQRIYGVQVGAGGEHATGLIPILFPRTDAGFASVIMLICLAVGIIYLFWAWGLRAQLARKHGQTGHFWEAVAIMGGLLGLILLAYISKIGADFGALGNFGNPLVLVMLAGFLVFVVGYIRIIRDVPILPIELLSQGGNIISFTRLFAVGVAAAILANLATDLGWSLGGVLPVIGPILGILIGLFVHSFFLALTLIGHIMQPLRLHYLEFLNPTGFYQESGPRYVPFARASVRK
ncbi:V-type ATP synthase subunit I [Deinococcus metallilatus]|uniref:V-type ATP synthase subunit I n=1 Tax=Deinococcus metallilatus TaxID=1211322 RepID=A0AAJ5F2T4_9DEIO|nr:V-type ATP synthase subunit I [Deinococcus metallilatus]MBB5296199.1 V/A-type H+-transporting ATPase subunit I [Deinococcus metallilatus]QBY09754.1 V-type ATP synthase subunit I [Deinococcus metallilatus]RXJ08952.1 V-type ATP synthase subunit I [Deinococcus metallilatus]TLK23669.1 V-type ATP synthase subunit I [Deinococcus metallilatus]GMA14065.1 v-type ATP synthase subunit I [Deinococcus metallilatus]